MCCLTIIKKEFFVQMVFSYVVQNVLNAVIGNILLNERVGRSSITDKIKTRSFTNSKSNASRRIYHFSLVNNILKICTTEFHGSFSTEHFFETHFDFNMARKRLHVVCDIDVDKIDNYQHVLSFCTAFVRLLAQQNFE